MGTSNDHSQAKLRALFDAIASRDHAQVTRLIEELPELVRAAAAAGATRDNARAHFFEQIAHYAYAEDTPLHLAAAAHDPGIVTELLAKGANVRARNRRGAEPLHYAADGIPSSPQWNPAGQSKAIELLIATGADPNATDKSGVAALHRAVRSRCADAVRALLMGGADPRLKNKQGSTPLHLAVQATGRGGSGEAAARNEQTTIIQRLLSHGARAADENASGQSVTACAKAVWLRKLLGGA